MKLSLPAAAAALVVSSFPALNAQDVPTDPKAKLSYSIGVNIGTGMSADMAREEIDVDKTLLIDGFKDGMTGAKTKLTKEEMDGLMQKFGEEMQAKMAEKQQKMQAEQEKAATENKAKGDKFLAENKSKEGWKTTDSGLQYKIVTTGKGAKPKPDETVSVHYTGTLTDGTKFDSSVDRGEPAEFPVNRVIPGWTEALQMMPVGSEYELAIPADLAYGPQEQANIPSNSVLLFNVKLLEIKKDEPAPAPADKKAE